MLIRLIALDQAPQDKGGTAFRAHWKLNGWPRFSPALLFSEILKLRDRKADALAMQYNIPCCTQIFFRKST